MKILYGVCGEGFGHATHATAVARYLKKLGNEILILTYGKGYKILKDEFNCVEVADHYSLYNKRGKELYVKSLAFTVKNIIKERDKTETALEKINDFNPDLVISDHEKISCNLSYSFKIPLITISNQNRFLYFKMPKMRKKLFQFLIARVAVFIVAPKADYRIALSLFEMDSNKDNCQTVNPIIKEEIKNLKTSYDGDILVYLRENNPKIIERLRDIGEKFFIYGTKKRGRVGNLYFKGQETFLEDLSKCRAMISNGGFTSVGEALYLKKPYLGIPLKRHFEQEFNSKFLKKNELGYYSKYGNKNDILFFIKNLDAYRKNLKKYKQKDNSETFKIIDQELGEAISLRAEKRTSKNSLWRRKRNQKTKK